MEYKIENNNELFGVLMVIGAVVTNFRLSLFLDVSYSYCKQVVFKLKISPKNFFITTTQGVHLKYLNSF